MKTNVKNGLFIFDYIPVDTAQIKITDAETNAQPTIFQTGSDGLYVILAETNEDGVVTSLIIDVGEHALPENLQNEVVIEDESILIKDNETFELI